MNVENARRVMETTCADTVNQYLRFGWTLVNQYVVEATAETPARVKYVLASIRRLEDTREVIALTDAAAVNAYLQTGWKLIDKYATGAIDPAHRDETLHFVLGWQSDEPPQHPAPPQQRSLEGVLEAGQELC